VGAGPLILIPPSEGKATGGSGDPWQPGTSRFATLDDPRQRVVKALLRAMRGSAVRRGALLGVKGGALAAATAANRSVREAPTMAAIERYTGVLYAELDPATLPRRSLTRARDQVVVVSGMWGLGAPFDPIPDYKLAMGSSLEGLGRLSTWWRPHVTHALAEVAGGRTVWDLLPNEHAAAWAPDAASLDARVRVRFLDRSVGADGEERLVAVSHWNKLLKGALVRHLLATQLDDPAGLIHFDHPLGYRYDPARTETHGTQVTVSLLRET
jgi:cytoplasmic iron level regulating protein YaaA (DUF328/UPF0246 family)